jgi:hypothetical protein
MCKEDCGLQWYHTVSLEQYALETLQEEYCYQYHKLFGKFPLPSVMSRDILISQISNMRRSSAQQS